MAEFGHKRIFLNKTLPVVSTVARQKTVASTVATTVVACPDESLSG